MKLNASAHAFVRALLSDLHRQTTLRSATFIERDGTCPPANDRASGPTTALSVSSSRIAVVIAWQSETRTGRGRTGNDSIDVVW